MNYIHQKEQVFNQFCIIAIIKYYLIIMHITTNAILEHFTLAVNTNIKI